MKARIYVTLKKEVLDPQGKAIERSVHKLGFADISGVRAGKLFDVEIEAADPQTARKRLEEIGQKLLSNPVIEHVEVQLSA